MRKKDKWFGCHCRDLALFIPSCKVLSWRIGSLNNDKLSMKDLRETFLKALQKWEAVTNLNFRRSASLKPDIWFKFVKRAHGDAYPFPPGGSVLAHAFYPAGDDKGWFISFSLLSD